jgi:hypothetical protein
MFQALRQVAAPVLAYAVADHHQRRDQQSGRSNDDCD